jgi:hypothetical protein
VPQLRLIPKLPGGKSISSFTLRPDAEGKFVLLVSGLRRHDSYISKTVPLSMKNEQPSVAGLFSYLRLKTEN